MLRCFLTLVSCVLGFAAPALADCNPPPPGLSFDDWTNLCPAEIENAYQYYGNGGNYDDFVGYLYGIYLNASQGGSTGGVPPLASCASDGATQCNSSGWLYTCTNGQWLTGSVKCGG